MFRFNNFLIASSLVFLTTSCSTSLSVKKLEDSKNVNGVIYYLPRSSFQVSIKRELNKCPYAIDDKVYIDVSNKVEVVYSTISDISNAYVIDYDSLSSATKEFDIEVSMYPNGTLKSINTTSSDKTGEIIASVAKTAAMLALVNTTGAGGLAMLTASGQGEKENQGLTPLPIPLCSDAVKQALVNRDSAKSEFKDANEKLAAKLKELLSLKKLVKDEAGIEAPAPAYEAALKALGVLNTDAAIKENILDEINSKLTYTSTYQLYGITIGSQDLRLSPEELEKSGWVENKKYADATTVSADILKLFFNTQVAYVKEEVEDKAPEVAVDKLGAGPEVGAPEDAVEKQKANGNSLIASSVFERDDVVEHESESDDDSGIVYQQGANVSIKICKDEKCANSNPQFNKIVYASDAGSLARLPYKNDAFQENSFEAKFSDKGMLEYVKYSSNSPAENAADTLSDVADAYASYKTKRHEYEKAEIEALAAKSAADDAKELADLDHQIAILKKAKELEVLSKQADAEIGRLKRELELKKLLKEIDDLEPDEAAEELARIKIQVEIEKLLSGE